MKVLAFGSFDPFHKGHRYFLERARSLGDYLITVVARDEVIASHKKRQPDQREDTRMEKVAMASAADEVVLGDKSPENYSLLSRTNFNILALGYDQQPADSKIRDILADIGKSNVKIERLPAHKPEKYKSTLLRT